MRNNKLCVTLPCEIGSKVYTISRDDCPCETCIYGKEVNYSPMDCYNSKKDYKCPLPVFSIVEHICEGFMISGNEQGNPVVSKPGEWGCEGLEQFYGDDGKTYYSYDDAEKAICGYLGLETIKICDKNNPLMTTGRECKNEI